MDTLIQDTLDLLRDIAKTTPSVFATAEEMTYFAPVVSTLNKTHKVEKKDDLKNVSYFQAGFQAGRSKASAEQKAPEQAPRASHAPLPPQTITFPIEKKNLNDMSLLIKKTFPDLSLRETIPDDAMARKRSRLWKETYLSAQVVVIAFGEIGPGLEFLKQVTHAINRLIAPAELIEGSVIEKEQGWDLVLSSPSLKTVVCSPLSSWKRTSLAKYYVQNGSSGEQFLGKHRLLLLEPSLLYLKHPDHKRTLWQLLSTQLSS